LARTAAGNACSWSNGPPGASRMMKNETLSKTNKVGTRPAIRRSV
jgi:hypothetical protein